MSKTYNLAVIPGDGIGPEVVAEGLKALDVLAKKFDFKLQLQNYDFGGQRYLDTGEILPDSAVEEFRKMDAIYLGGIGHPDVKPGVLEKGILLKLRFDLDQYINLRPVKLYPNVQSPLKNIIPSDIDYIVFRENTGGLYTGVGEFQNKGTADEVAIQSMIYSRSQVDRCLKYSFEYLRRLHKDNPWVGLTNDEKAAGKIAKLTLCGKTNVLTYVFDLWQRAFDEMAADYPDIITDYVHVDAICIYMIENPQRFNGIVTGNMFGDIITDLAAVLQGGMGVAPSGNINPNGVSMFEPVHGTAPSFTGQNVINPVASLLTAMMLLRHLNEMEAADCLERAITSVITKMKSMLVGQMGMSTTDVGDAVVKAILE